jgi:hypothetical protein
MPYIVPSERKLGVGNEKIAYACRIIEDKTDAKVAFDIIEDVNAEKDLCIIEVIHQTRRDIFDKVTGEFTNAYSDFVMDNFSATADKFGSSPSDLVRAFHRWDPKTGPLLNRPVMWSIDDYKFENEMRLQMDFAKHGFAPKIYGIKVNGEMVSIDEITKKLRPNMENAIFVLMEKCVKRQKSDDPRKFLGNLRQLVSHFVDNENLINMDFKDGNVCPLGRLTGLDFDTQYMLIIGDEDKELLKKHGKTYMLTQFLAETGLNGEEHFDKMLLETVLHINRKAIEEMVIFFGNHPVITLLQINPINQLCHYCIKSGPCNINSRHFVNELCGHIFRNINGGKRSEGKSKKTYRKKTFKKKTYRMKTNRKNS